MSHSRILLLAGAYALAMILGTQFFQYVVGVAPCEMCYWQRWPLEAVIVIGLGGAALDAYGKVPPRTVTLLAWLSLLLIATTGLIGAYQAGVEWKFLPGPTSCTGQRYVVTGNVDLSHVTPVVPCDVVQWSLFGLSLAGYNAIFSLGTAVLGTLLMTGTVTLPGGKR